jgi:hypothetical protein
MIFAYFLSFTFIHAGIIHPLTSIGSVKSKAAFVFTEDSDMAFRGVMYYSVNSMTQHSIVEGEIQNY